MVRAKYTVRVSKLLLTNCVQIAHKLRTDQLQYFGGTTTHQSLPLDETASNCWVSQSRNSQFFEIPCFQKFCPSRPSIFFPKLTKNHQKKIAGLHPAPPPNGAAPLLPTKVPAKCLAAVVLAHPDVYLTYVHASFKFKTALFSVSHAFHERVN